MKSFLFLINLLFSSVFATESFQINDMVKTDERDFFELISSDNQDYTLDLDCQSFFHGISYKNDNTNEFILLDTFNCGMIYYEISQSLSKNKSMCLHLDFKQKDWALDPEISNCP